MKMTHTVCDLREGDSEIVYAYKQYCDGYAYGEELIKLYHKKEAAKGQLKKDVEEFYNCSFEDVHKKAEVTEDDTVRPDYVSIEDGEGVHFWVIEALEIE